MIGENTSVNPLAPFSLVPIKLLTQDFGRVSSLCCGHVSECAGAPPGMYKLRSLCRHLQALAEACIE